MWGPDDMLGDMFRKAPPPSPEGPQWCLPQKTGLSLLGIKEPPREKRRQIRCPRCKRRLLPVSIHCIGGEFVCWALPPHKLPPRKKAKPQRKERKARFARR